MVRRERAVRVDARAQRRVGLADRARDAGRHHRRGRRRREGAVGARDGSPRARRDDADVVGRSRRQSDDRLADEVVGAVRADRGVDRRDALAVARRRAPLEVVGGRESVGIDGRVQRHRGLADRAGDARRHDRRGLCDERDVLSRRRARGVRRDDPVVVGGCRGQPGDRRRHDLLRAAAARGGHGRGRAVGGRRTPLEDVRRRLRVRGDRAGERRARGARGEGRLGGCGRARPSGGRRALPPFSVNHMFPSPPRAMP